jgi:hypothetical protein
MRMANFGQGHDFDVHAAVRDEDMRDLELAAEAGDLDASRQWVATLSSYLDRLAPLPLAS